MGEPVDAAPRSNRRRKAPEPIEELFKPSFSIFVGRGSTGKTTVARWVCDRAQRPVLVYDGDADHIGLQRFVDGAMVTASADDIDVRQGFEDLIDRHLEERIDVVIDLGGGDRVFPTLAYHLDLHTFLVEEGSKPAIFYLAGPDPADLALLTELEADGLFAPERTGILFNEHLIPRHMPDRVFKDIVGRDEVLQRAIKRGAQVARIPRLETADRILEAGVSFQYAVKGCALVDGLPLSPTQRQQTRRWLERLHQSMEPMLDWLP
ncbi:AAA family ATPase [Lichenibacterium minor]|uniref:AAA family ATPase n=1 Tax=Lichenibacterium minor TaxID=2316528 RepID=A0A4Q2TZ13_9HYPH|nr:ATP-binding protein [Lichenibacterium minor]RYC28960.1 AAA family ATPase [Lichenibacterium minor]